MLHNVAKMNSSLAVLSRFRMICGTFCLSHNHMLLVLRAFLTRAKWDMPACEEQNLTFCDKDWKLSLTAVAATPNGKELGEVMAEGIEVEIRSCKMEVEEPDAERRERDELAADVIT